MTQIETIKRKWKKVGFRFNCRTAKEVVDVEQLIVDTVTAGRDEPVLIWGMVAWLIAYADLVNIARLLRMISPEIQPIIGSLFELAVENGADAKLKNVIRNCRPKRTPGILFTVMGKTRVTAKHEKTHSLSVFKKWGLYCSTISLKTDALYSRHFILQNNKNLALRAVFGANTKSEILHLLLQLPRAYISQVAREIQLSYQPVYAEVKHLLINQLIECEQIGRMRIISLSGKTVEFLKVLPV